MACALRAVQVVGDRRKLRRRPAAARRRRRADRLRRGALRADEAAAAQRQPSGPVLSGPPGRPPVRARGHDRPAVRTVPPGLHDRRSHPDPAPGSGRRPPSLREPTGGVTLTSMRRVVVYPGRIAVEAADIPAPRPNQALVPPLAVGVCGSALPSAHARHPFVPLPYRPGHEVVGVIETAGSAVPGYAAGQRGIVEPDLPCWTCKMCTSGPTNLCENLQFFGCGYAEGGMADYFTLTANRLHPVPDTPDDPTPAIIKPLSTPVTAVRLAGDVCGRP